MARHVRGRASQQEQQQEQQQQQQQQQQQKSGQPSSSRGAGDASGRPQWNVQFPATERGIPPYDAAKDRARRDAERKRALRQKPGFGAQAAHVQQKEKTRKARDAPGEVILDVGKNFAPGKARKKSSISLQLVHDEAKGVEMNVIKRILERESLRSLLLENAGKVPTSKDFPRKTCIKLAQEVRDASLLVVEAISKWRDCMPEPLPFVFENRNYLLRVLDDLGPLDAHEPLRAAIAKHFRYDPSTFRLRGNPFLLPVNGVTDKVVIPQTDDLPKVPSIDPQDTSHLADLGARRTVAAWALLEEEYERVKQRLADCQKEMAADTAVEEAADDQRFRTKSHSQSTTTLSAGPNDQGRKMSRARVRPRSSSAAPKLAPLPYTRRRPKSRDASSQSHGRACACHEPAPAFSVSVALASTTQNLPPLTDADLHAFRHDSRSKLERMDADIEASQRVVDTLEAAVAEVQERLRAYEKQLRRPTPRPPPELEALRNKFQRISKSLHYRRIELQRKHLARHCFVQDQAMRVDRAMRAQVKQDLREPLVPRDPASPVPESVKDPGAAEILRLIARTSVTDSLDAAVEASVCATTQLCRSSVAQGSVSAAVAQGGSLVARNAARKASVVVARASACALVQGSLGAAMDAVHHRIGLVARDFVSTIIHAAVVRVDLSKDLVLHRS